MSYDAPPPPPPPPGGGYGQQPPYGAAPQGSNKKAIWALVLGILSIFCCGLFAGIPAIILGRQAQTTGGGGMAKAGEILGYIGVALSVLWIVLAVTGNAITFNTN